MDDFSFSDETLDINLTQSYNLSIQVNLNGFSFCILDPVRKKYIAFSNFNVETDLVFDDFLNAIEAYIKNNDLLNHSYKNIKLIWLSNKNTLIPSGYFKKENLKKYFEFNQKLDDLDEIHYHELNYVDAYSVYSVPNQITNIFIRQFPKLKFYNQQIPFIEMVLFKYHSESKKAFVNINKGFIDLCITENGKLLLYNNFSYKTEPDIIYFIMYIFNQFDLNAEVTELILSGFIDNKSLIYLKLKTFIRHLRFNKLPDDISYSYTFNKIPSHSFINLFNLHLCE